ncbi:ankyrin repeat-containing protein, putative [Cordyceps militaris CM01]|uniref:Ankyrin repeat-containing protein, putative n=1 Tax=Cordyceps militaris (strain CM01) TaxID=983644 RepID=G3JMX3_CORMM|nr:ankyrin repeat-containing protein, putative [Cordyceps militaris CM01]EGX90155.1 ankyrin repeat-containing protein, putative [Cordyceps militaris CM01]
MNTKPNQLAKTVHLSTGATTANHPKPCPWSRCPDAILQAVAARLANRADISRLARASRQCHRAANPVLYAFDLRDDNSRASALLWACCLSKADTARMALAAGADPNAEWPPSLWQMLERHAPRFDPARGASTRNALYVVASLGDVDMARLLIEAGGVDFSKPVQYPAEAARGCVGQPVRYEDPPLFSAISMDCAELLHFFLQTYGDDVRDLSGSTMLTRAVREQRPAALRTILRNEDCSDPLGAGDVNGLIQAVYKGDAGLVRLILAKSRSDPNVIRRRHDDSRCHGGIHGQTPLVVAVCHGHEDVVRVLCADPRVDINLAGPNHRAPVFYALTQHHWGLVDVLLGHGAAYDAELAFELACLHRQRDWMVRLVRATTFDETRLEYWYKMGRSLLRESAAHWSEVELELDKKRAVFAKNWRRDTALPWILLEAGSRIDYAPCPGFPPIIVAVLSGRCRMTKFLIEKGAKLNVWTPDGDGPLAAAVYVNSAECVEALLAVLEDADEKDAIEDINEEESSRPTALIRAAGGNHEGFVRRLLGRAEVNPNRMWIRDEGPWLTPLTVACIMDSVACVQLLCQDGRTDLKRMDSYTATALLTAVRKASWDVAFYLLGLERLRQHRWREVGEFLFSLSPGYRYDARAVEFATELIRRVHMTDEIATSWKQIATGSGNRHIVKLIDLELARKLMIPPCSAERFQPLMHMYKE